MYVWQILKKLQNGKISECYVMVDLGNKATLFLIDHDSMLAKFKNYDEDTFINVSVDGDNNLIVG